MILHAKNNMCILLLILTVFGCNRQITISQSKTKEKIGGIIFDGPAYPPITEKMFESLDTTNVDWIATTPEAFTYKNTLGVKSIFREGQWYGETIEASLNVIRIAKSKGHKVMLKPHIGFTYDLSGWDSPEKKKMDSLDAQIKQLLQEGRKIKTDAEKEAHKIKVDAYNKEARALFKPYDASRRKYIKSQEDLMQGSWRGDFAVKDTSNWKVWEKGYEKFILNCAKIADSTQVDLFCVGTELSIAATQREAFWRALIKKVKNIYKGPVTYNANWDNFKNIKFWDELDYIGVSAYFPVSKKEEPSIADAVDGWKNYKTQLANISKQYQKPILFTEYGYKSIKFAGDKPWKEYIPNEADEKIQANLYEALYATFWDENWFAGGFIWKWYYKGNGGEKSYSPQGKAAEKIMNDRYQKIP